MKSGTILIILLCIFCLPVGLGLIILANVCKGFEALLDL